MSKFNTFRFFQFSALSIVLAFAIAFTPCAYAQNSKPKPKLHKTAESTSKTGTVQGLQEGNSNFQKGKMSTHNYVNDREELLKGQHPQTIVLACSDSRVVPEFIFDAGLGEVFVIRTAGNVVDSVAIGSIEYAAEHLHAKNLLVLGHTHCGAVTAAVGGESESPYINSIIHKISPAVKSAKRKNLNKEEELDYAIVENVKNQMEYIEKNSKIIEELVSEGKLKVMGGMYDIGSGKVEFIEGDEVKHKH